MDVEHRTPHAQPQLIDGCAGALTLRIIAICREPYECEHELYDVRIPYVDSQPLSDRNAIQRVDVHLRHRCQQARDLALRPRAQESRRQQRTEPDRQCVSPAPPDGKATVRPARRAVDRHTELTDAFYCGTHFIQAMRSIVQVKAVP